MPPVCPGRRRRRNRRKAWYSESLVQLALDGGGRDNVTALVVQINEARPSLWKRLLMLGKDE